MTRIIEGDRIGRQAQLLIGCSAAIFDAAGERLLLTRRADNGQWCLPGGAMEPGESAAEACASEVWEETGLRVCLGSLIGVYSSPNRIIEYPDGNRYHVVSLLFFAEPISGELAFSDETTEFGYFTSAEIAGLDLLPSHRERIPDAFARQEVAFVR
ncbi:MAG: NUDIX domain-containing protein [Chloroflexia bacterium]